MVDADAGSRDDTLAPIDMTFETFMRPAEIKLSRGTFTLG
jgi:hypothetical protein